MKNTDLAKFKVLLTEVMSYYEKNTSPFMLTLYWDAFNNFDFEQVRKALNQHCIDPESGRFAPKVADIVKILAGTVTDRSALAWGKFYDAMSRVGCYQDVAFDDPAIHAAAEDIGGWHKACTTPSKDVSYLQHQFCNSYKAYVNKGKFDYPKVLVGIRSPDSVYRMSGLNPPKPVLIGDAKVAMNVYLNGNSYSVGNKAITSFQSIEKLVAGNVVLLGAA